MEQFVEAPEATESKEESGQEVDGSLIGPRASAFLQHLLDPAQPEQSKEWRVMRACSKFPAGSTSYDEYGNRYVYVENSRFNELKSQSDKQKAERQFLQDNGVALVCDSRVRPGDYIFLHKDTWVCNPLSLESMIRQVESRGLRVRDLSKKEAERLTYQAKVKIDTELRLQKQQKKNGKKIAKAKGSRP